MLKNQVPQRLFMRLDEKFILIHFEVSLVHFKCARKDSVTGLDQSDPFQQLEVDQGAF